MKRLILHATCTLAMLYKVVEGRVEIGPSMLNMCQDCRSARRRYCYSEEDGGQCCGPEFSDYFPTDELIRFNMDPFYWFKQATKYSDGKLDLDYISNILETEGAKSFATNIFWDADSNNDDKVTAMELATYVFNLVDTNKNGKIEIEEAEAALEQVSIYTRLKKTGTR